MIDAYHEHISGAKKADAISHTSVRHPLAVVTIWLFLIDHIAVWRKNSYF
jgi:hypothetical protein